MGRPAAAGPTRPRDIVDDGLTDLQIATKVAEWLDAIEAEPVVDLPLTAAEELAAARRDGDL